MEVRIFIQWRDKSKSGSIKSLKPLPLKQPTKSF